MDKPVLCHIALHFCITVWVSHSLRLSYCWLYHFTLESKHPPGKKLSCKVLLFSLHFRHCPCCKILRTLCHPVQDRETRGKVAASPGLMLLQSVWQPLLTQRPKMLHWRFIATPNPLQAAMMSIRSSTLCSQRSLTDAAPPQQLARACAKDLIDHGYPS